MKIQYAVPAMALALMVSLATLGMTIDQTGNTSNVNSGLDTGATPYQMLTGTVQAVDNANNTLNVKDSSGHVQTVKADSDTEISREGSPVQLSEIRTGDVVVIRKNNATM